MIVQIIHDSTDRFPNKGETYYVERYPYDSDKVTLHYLLNPVTLEKTGISME